MQIYNKESINSTHVLFHNHIRIDISITIIGNNFANNVKYMKLFLDTL